MKGTRIPERTLPHAGMVLAAVLVLSLALATVAVSTPATAATQDSEPIDDPTPAEPSANNETADSTDNGTYDLAELRDGGQAVPGADPSMRWIGETGSVFIDYPSADPLSPEAEDWQVENVLKSGSTVQRDELTINAQRQRGASDETYVLQVVTYEIGEVEIEGEDGDTRTERVATDQRTTSHELEFSGAFDRSTIDLTNSDGESREVAMWLEDSTGDRVDGAQWSFTHKSSPTTTDAGISTMGELYQWVGLFVLLPGLVGIPLSIRTAGKIHDKTGRGPMLSGGLYVGLVFLFGFGVLMFAWIQFAKFITGLPLILGISIVAVAFVGYLETGGNEVQRVQFVRDELGEAVSPNGDDVSDTIYQETADVRMTRLDENGTYVLLRKGIRPFLARLFGVAATLDVSDLETQIKMETVEVAKGEPWDRKFIADPAADSALDWEPPALTFPLKNEGVELPEDPELSDWLQLYRWQAVLWAGIGALMGWTMGSALVDMPMFGASVGLMTAFAIAVTKVEDGHAEFEPAPTHYTAARPQVLDAGASLSDARTIDDLEAIALEATTDTALEGRRIQSRMDSTVTQRMNRDELGIGETDDRDDRADDDRADDAHQEETDDDESEDNLPVVRGD